MLRESVNKIINNENLSEKHMYNAVGEIMEGKVLPSLMASFLTALKIKGETIEEITGGAKAMRDKAEKIDLSEYFTIDTCGTGGDKSGTYNISTAVSFVCAAADVKVVKHGNRSVSSKSGSADILETLGVNVNLNPADVKKCVDEENMGFLFAPVFHKAMKYAAPVRKELGFRTIFNILGPLTNPANPKAQVLGVFDEALTETMAEVLKNLDVTHALVVHGMDGLDEISISTKTKVTELIDNEIKTYYIEPEEFGLKKYSKDEVLGGTAEENADIIKEIFLGKKGAKRDILLINSGAALYVSKKVKSIREGVKLAEELIDSGKVYDKMNSFVKYTRTL